MKKYFLPFILVANTIALFAMPMLASAATQITANIPGRSDPAIVGPVAFVGNIYEFALMIGGILAFGVIVYGGVKYMTSAGNPSGQSDAKEWIESALLGLLLLAGAYLILNVINPQLTQLQLPTLTTLNIQGSPGAPTGGGGGGGGGPLPTGCAGSGCQDLSAAGFACKQQQPPSCSAAPQMINTLQCIQSKVGSGYFTVTEAMPPTVPHQSRCHQNGCCVDTRVNNPTCAQIQSLMNAAAACGATAANEYAGCAGSTIYPTTQGGNVHINSIPGGGC